MASRPTCVACLNWGLLRDFSGYPLFVTHFSPPRLPSGRAQEARGRKMLESGGKRRW